MPRDGTTLPAVVETVRLVAELRPFAGRADRVVLDLAAGLTLAEMVERAGIRPGLRPFAVAYIGDHRIDWAMMHRVRPKAGALVAVKIVPGFGGSTGRSIALLAVMAAAVAASVATGGLLLPVTGPVIAGVGAAFAGAAVSLAGTLAINALMPVQQPRLENLAGASTAARTSPTLSITGSRNRLAPYAPVPRPFGKWRERPPMAARPFTEIVGDDQYLRLLFDFGYGPNTLSNMKIGDVDLTEYDDVTTVTYEDYQGETLTLYPDTVGTESFNIEVTKAGGPLTVVTAASSAEIVIDTTLYEGLFQDQLVTGGGGSDMVRTAETVQVKLEHRLNGTADPFVDAGTTTYTAYTKSLARFAIRVVLPSVGKWDVRVTRLTNDNTQSSANTERRTRTHLTALKSIAYASPVNVTGHTILEMRIRATDQVNGVVDTFSAEVQAKLPIWNGTSFDAATATRNPAWAALEVLRGGANARGWADANLDLAQWKAFADRCDAADQNGEPKYRFDGVVDFSTTVFQLVRDILSTARADFTIRDGKASVVWDDPDATVVQAFTPKNSWGFRASRTYPRLPHALRVRFVNEAADWQEDEITVYDDGFDATSATTFENLELWGVSRESQAWREGRYRIAEGRLRPELIEFSADIEHLVCQRGDLVRMTHDVMLWGLGSGRLKSMTTDGGGNVTTVTLDETVTMEAGKSYGIVIRKASDTSFSTHAVDTAAGNTATLTLTTAIPSASAPAVGDFVQFGLANAETVTMKVKAILPGPELSARLVCVDPAPAVHTSDTGSIPAFNPRITVPPVPGVEGPPKPVVLDVKSDESVLIPVAGGGLEPRILVTLQAPANTSGLDRGEAQYRPNGTDQVRDSFDFPADATAVSFRPVFEGLEYDLRLRYRSTAGVESEFSLVTKHKVVGKSTKPPDVPSALIDANDLVTWTYPDEPVDLAGYQVRYHQGINTAWASALKAHTGLLSVTQFDGAGLPSGTLTVMIKARDVALNESVNPAVLLLGLGDPLVANVVVTRDFKDTKWFPGTIINGGIDGNGDLVANAGGVFWSKVDATVFWTADSTVAFWTAVFVKMTYTTQWAPPASGQLTLALTVAAVGWSIEYRPSGAQVAFWSGTVSTVFWTADTAAFWQPQPAFQPWPGAVQATAQPYDFRLITEAGAIQGKVSKFIATVDVVDVIERLDDVVIASGGTRLAITKTYSKITSVLASIQDDGNAARSLEIVDKNVSLGPLIKARNSADVPVAALIDAEVQGFNAGDVSSTPVDDTLTLDHDFAADGHLNGRRGPAITLTRADPGTYFDSAGVMRTAGIDVARFHHDPANGTALGLMIEKDGNNVYPWSKDLTKASGFQNLDGVAPTVTANIAIAPNGTLTADRAQWDAGTQVGAYAGFTFVSAAGASTKVTASIRARSRTGVNQTAEFRTLGSIGVKIITMTSEWQRFTVTSPAATTSRQFQLWSYVSVGTTRIVDIDVSDVQLEETSSASSDISTAGASASRAAEVDSANVAAELGSANTPFVAARTGFGAGVLWQIDDGTENERYRIERNASDEIQLIVTAGGVVQADLNLGAVADQTDFTVAARLAANDFAASLDGAAVVTDSSGSLPTVNTERFGMDTAGDVWGGTIAKRKLWNLGQPDAFLEALRA